MRKTASLSNNIYDLCIFAVYGKYEVAGFRREICIKEDGWKAEYSGDNHLLMEELGDFSFTDRKQAMMELWEYYEEHIEEIDESELL